MRKITTTFFLLLAMILLLPAEAGAWNNLNLRSTINANWTGTDDDLFTRTDENNFQKEISSGNLTSDIYFRLYLNDGGDNSYQMIPEYKDGEVIEKDTDYKAVKDESGESSWCWKIEGGKYSQCTINVKYTNVYNNTWDFYVYITVTENVTSKTYTLIYDGSSVTGTTTSDGVNFSIPSSAYDNGLSFTISDSEGNTYNPSQDTELSNGVAVSYTISGTGNWTCKEVANSRGYTVALNTTDQTVTMKWSTSVVIPTLTKNLYLVGNFIYGETSINYDSRYFKLIDNGDGTYYFDIPTSLAADYQLLYDDGVTSKLYGPQGSGYGIGINHPSSSGTVTGDLSEATENSNYWTQTNRFTSSKIDAGLYRITIKLGEDGMPSSWEITHDPLTRVAYYLPNMENASLQPSYVKRTETSSTFNNVYFGYVYLPAETGCYVVSNVCGQGYELDGLLKPTEKLYLQGNKTGGSPTGGSDDVTKVYPKDGGSQPFVFANDKNMSMFLEYAPARGNSNYSFNDIFGEVLRSNQVPVTGGGDGSSLPTEFENLKIIGPAIGDDTWSTENGLLMKYNPADNCWEVSFDTDFPATDEKKFRFIANDEWKYSWEENGTDAADKAKIPYDDENLTGQPATVSVPNEVALVSSSTTSVDTRTPELDIIFNRNAGHWTVKFYIDVEGTDGAFKYNFRYTINGTPTINVPVNITELAGKFIRTFSYGQDLDLPADESVKAYEAYKFVIGDKETKAHGTVYLRRITYIPANEGVVLVGDGTAEQTFTCNLTVRTENLVTDKADLWWRRTDYSNDEWNNYLVGTVTAVADLGNAKTDEDGNITERYFGLGSFHETKEYQTTQEGDDYIGFFRLTTNGRSGANKAYLSIPTSPDSKYGYIDFNGQWLDDEIDSPETTAATLVKAAILFDDEVFGETTAIQAIAANYNDPADNAYYTLQGIRVSKPTQGIYVHNGKKIIIK